MWSVAAGAMGRHHDTDELFVGGSRDADGDLIPKLDATGKIMTEDVTPAAFGKYQAKVTIAASEIVQRIIALRETARDALRNATTDSEKSRAHGKLTRVGEMLGQRSVPNAIARRYPARKFDVVRIQDPSVRGQGVFDGVFRVTPRKGDTRPFIVIVEAKGPSGHLGARKGAGELSHQQFQQGHPEYLASILEEMKNSVDTRVVGLAFEIEQSLKSNNLRYELVRARVNSKGDYVGYFHSEFDIYNHR